MEFISLNGICFLSIKFDSLNGICFPSAEFVFFQWNLSSLNGICLPSMEFNFPIWNLGNMRSGVLHRLADWLFFEQEFLVLSCQEMEMKWISDCWQMTSWWTAGLQITCFDSALFSNINVCKQFDIMLRSSTIFFHVDWRTVTRRRSYRCCDLWMTFVCFTWPLYMCM